MLQDLDTADLRVHRWDFSRGGVLSPDLLVTILLYMTGDSNRRGYGHLLDRFWDQATDFGIDLPSAEPVSAPSFCAARDKLAPEFLRSLIHEVYQRVEADFPDNARFRGRRVLAIDGCKTNLRRSHELDNAFGRPTGAHVPQALVSALVNVCNRTPMDVSVHKHATCERSVLLEEHLQFLQPEDILVLDRGYPSYEVVSELLEAGVDFVIRTPKASTFPAITEFLESGRDDSVVYLDLPRVNGREATRVRLRAAKLDGDDDDGPMVFLTSLPRNQWSWSTLCQLYRLRWEEEELYKTFKADYFDQRQFHSKKTAGVQQEVCASFLFLAISRYLMGSVAALHDRPLREVSQKGSILGFADYLLRIFRQDPRQGAVLIQRLLDRIARQREKPRPRRSFPRRSFRPTRKWNATGRRGG